MDTCEACSAAYRGHNTPRAWRVAREGEGVLEAPLIEREVGIKGGRKGGWGGGVSGLANLEVPADVDDGYPVVGGARQDRLALHHHLPS